MEGQIFNLKGKGKGKVAKKKKPPIKVISAELEKWSVRVNKKRNPSGKEGEGILSDPRKKEAIC